MDPKAEESPEPGPAAACVEEQLLGTTSHPGATTVTRTETQASRRAAISLAPIPSTQALPPLDSSLFTVKASNLTGSTDDIVPRSATPQPGETRVEEVMTDAERRRVSRALTQRSTLAAPGSGMHEKGVNADLKDKETPWQRMFEPLAVGRIRSDRPVENDRGAHSASSVLSFGRKRGQFHDQHIVRDGIPRRAPRDDSEEEDGLSGEEDGTRPEERRTSRLSGWGGMMENGHDLMTRWKEDTRMLKEHAREGYHGYKERARELVANQLHTKRSRRAHHEKLLLNVYLYEAKGLQPRQKDNTANPYVVIYFEGHKVKSRKKKNTISPRWNQEWQFPVNSGTPEIEIFVRDRDGFWKRSLAYLKLDLTEMLPGDKGSTGFTQKWYRLEPPQRRRSTRGWRAGDLLLGFGFTIISVDPSTGMEQRIERTIIKDSDRVMPELGVLEVSVFEGRDLLVMDINGRSDPYVILNIEDQKAYSKIAYRTLSPQWNMSYSFWTTQANPRVEITLMDDDRYGSDDFMGTIVVELKDIQAAMLEQQTKAGGIEGWYDVTFNGEVSGQVRLGFNYTPIIRRDVTDSLEGIKEHLGTVTISLSKGRAKGINDGGSFELYFHGDYLSARGKHNLRVFLTSDFTRLEPLRHGSRAIGISSEFHKFKLRFQDEEQAKKAWYILSGHMQPNGMNRFWANFPPREGNKVTFYADGCDYYPAVADAIYAAKNTIFIVDWWMSPEVFLKRHKSPPSLKYRLDNLLQYKAMQGVKVYVVLYSETALQLNSAGVVKKLQALHPNIHAAAHAPPVQKIYFSHHQKFVVLDQSVAFVGGLDLCFGRYDTRDHPLTDKVAPYTFWGLDYYNSQLGSITNDNMAKPYEDVIDRSVNMRMPWHDVHSRVEGPAARDVAFTFIQRWNAAGRGDEVIEPVQWSDVVVEGGTVSVQVLRSMSWWSGHSYEERSIFEGYNALIRRARRFIYIEQQFFISAFNDDSKTVSNLLVQAIYDRLVQAIEGKEDFCIVILVPESPEGPLNAKTTQAVMHFQYHTICRGPKSLMGRLRERFANVDFDRYIGFFSLRKWDLEGSEFITNYIYVHSKLLIVDDVAAIIGSANINDRSMLGARDSECCLHIEDTKKDLVTVGDVSFPVSPAVHKFRMNLWNEHLGLPMDSNQTVDAVKAYRELFLPTATQNTAIYHEAWPGIPHTSIRTLSEMTKAPKTGNMDRVTSIMGHVIMYPMDFLCKENLDTVFGDKEALLDKKMFT